MSTVVTPFVFLIGRAPPVPPSNTVFSIIFSILTHIWSMVAYAASKDSLSLISLCRAMLGMKVVPEAYMSLRERFDFLIIALIFACLNAK